MSDGSRNVRVALTERALNDIRDIQHFSLEQWGLRIAEQYLDAIAATLDLLRENPELLRLETCFVSGLYFYRVRKHILVCDYESDLVIVLAVVHTSMDLPKRLSELEPRLLLESQVLRAKLMSQ